MHMGQSGIKISMKAFNQFFYTIFKKWMWIFIHDCIECQQNKQIIEKKFKLQRYKLFQKMPRISFIEYQWIQKDL